MKKTLSIIALSFLIITLTFNAFSHPCPQGNTGCTGVCIEHYDSGGKVDYWMCATGETGAIKDCTQTGDAVDVIE